MSCITCPLVCSDPELCYFHLNSLCATGRLDLFLYDLVYAFFVVVPVCTCDGQDLIHKSVSVVISGRLCFCFR